MRQVLTVLALVGGVGTAAAQTSDAEEVKATLVAMWEAVEHGDLERYASYLHSDFTSFGESDVYLNSGKEYEVRNIGDYLERETRIFVKENGRWLAIHGHYTAVQ